MPARGFPGPSVHIRFQLRHKLGAEPLLEQGPRPGANLRGDRGKFLAREGHDHDTGLGELLRVLEVQRPGHPEGSFGCLPERGDGGLALRRVELVPGPLIHVVGGVLHEGVVGDVVFDRIPHDHVICLRGSAYHTVHDALLDRGHDVTPVRRRGVESHGRHRASNGLGARDANVQALRLGRGRVLRLPGRGDADEALDEDAQELHPLLVQQRLEGRIEGRAGREHALHLLVVGHQIGDRVDFQLGIVVAVNEGVAHVDHALGHIAEDLLSVAQLTGGKEFDLQAHIGRIGIRLDLIERGGPVVADRVLTRNSQANLSAGRLRMGSNQEHCRGNGNPTVQLHLLRSQLILRPCGTVLILGENASVDRKICPITTCQEECCAG